MRGGAPLGAGAQAVAVVAARAAGGRGRCRASGGTDVLVGFARTANAIRAAHLVAGATRAARVGAGGVAANAVAINGVVVVGGTRQTRLALRVGRAERPFVAE